MAVKRKRPSRVIKKVKTRKPRIAAVKNISLPVMATLPEEKMWVERAKFEAAPESENIRQRRKAITLPSNYGDNKITVMVRDPWWVYAYWEITPHREAELKAQIAKEGGTFGKAILRVYDITGIENFNGMNANSYFDIPLKDIADNWFIEVAKPNCAWCVDIGMVAKDGRFYMLARSNYVKTPRFGMSNIFDEEWMCPEDEYWQLFGLSGGFGIGRGSMEIKELFKKHFKEWISSGAVSSFSSFVMSKKD